MVRELREMLQALGEIMQQVKQGLLSVTIVRVKGIWQDCDDISLAKAVLMANLSSYDSDVLLEVPQHETYQNDDMINQSVQEMHYFKQSRIDYVPYNNITSDSNIIYYEQYLYETQNAIG
ncbi:hypothetical protein Tco_1214570 [Tanacetum coccineum]